MTDDTIRAFDGGAVSKTSAIFRGLWRDGLLAAASWAAAALITVGLPDVVPWGSAGLFAALTGIAAGVFLVLSFVVHRLDRLGSGIIHYGPWFIAIGIWLAVWS